VSPREVIAKAIYDADYIAPDSEDFKVYYFKLADAVIDALEKMEVTETMSFAATEYWNPGDVKRMRTSDAWSIWRAMVGAMRDE